MERPRGGLPYKFGKVWNKSRLGELTQRKLHIEKSATNTQHFAALPSMVSHNSQARLRMPTSANDAVDGAPSAASECHMVVALKRTTLRGAVHGRGYHDWSRYCEVGIPGSRCR